MKIAEVLSDLKADFKRVSRKTATMPNIFYKALSNAGFRAIFLYRIGRYFYLKDHHFIAGFCQRLMHHWSHCWISVAADIGPGFLIAHVGSLVIGGETRIGKNCDVRQNVTFGGNFNKRSNDQRTQPWLEDNVSVGVGAVIIGPVKVGSYAIIGANTVVIRDVPENSIYFGVPGQTIKERWLTETDRGL
ncbi:MAG: serine O-acetyltransferase [Bacteroidales bacterium]